MIQEHKFKIIAADDDPATLVMYKKLLGDQYDLRTCDNGMDVLADFEIDPADLILLDNSMPDMNGQETTEALRQDSMSWNVPIIIVSAHDQEKDILDGLAFGADDYLVKPIKSAELLAKIKIALRKRDQSGRTLALETGSIFNGKYQIESELGRGGYSRVFKARDIRAEDDRDPWVALKVFEFDGSSKREEQIAYFLREAYEHSRLKHENIIELLDFGHVDNFYFLIMEYLEGITLADRIGMEGQLPEDDLLYYTIEICDALDAMDAHGLVHRDLKPSNIMLGVGRRVKLLDFGLAKNPGDETISMDDVFRGTPHFSSPEHILNEETLDIRSDIYSLGCSMYAAAAGTKPFEDENSMKVIRMQLNEQAPALAKLRPDLHNAYVKMIEGCMEKDPNARPTLEDIVSCCQTLLDQSEEK